GRPGSLAAALLGPPSVRAREWRLRAEARGLLAFVGYAGDPDALARNLPFGHKRLVEIARALARRPAVLLLDEPAAGLSQEEIAGLADLIARIRAAGTSVLLVGHHMDLVMSVSDRVTVLNDGRVIATGAPADVQQNSAVLEAYLGVSAGRGTVLDHASTPSVSPVPLASAETTPRSHGSRTAPRPPQPREAPPLLEVRDLTAAYGRMAVLHGVSLQVARGEMAVIIGANGAGKSTTLRAVAGLVAATRGEIRWEGRELVGRPAHRIARDGIALVPEGRLIFPDQSVLDNLRLRASDRRPRLRAGARPHRAGGARPRAPARRARGTRLSRAGAPGHGSSSLNLFIRGARLPRGARLVDLPSGRLLDTLGAGPQCAGHLT